MSVLAPSAVAAAVARGWGVEVRSCQAVRHGWNFHYRVDLDDGRYLFRIPWFHPNGLPHLPFELAATTAAAAAGAKIHFPRPTLDGALSVEIDAPEGPREGVLFSWSPGAPTAASDAGAYGRALAAFHDATVGLDASANARVLDLDYLVTSRLEAARVLLREIDGAGAWLDDFAEQVLSAVGALGVYGLDVGVVHGDAHLGNGHVEDDNVWLFDTEFVGIGWRAYDLAAFRWAPDFWRDIDVDDTYARFLQGYQSVRPLADADLAAVPALLSARFIWLLGHWALCETPTPNAIWHAPDALAPVLNLAKTAQAELR